MKKRTYNVIMLALGFLLAFIVWKFYNSTTDLKFTVAYLGGAVSMVVYFAVATLLEKQVKAS